MNKSDRFIKWAGFVMSLILAALVLWKFVVPASPADVAQQGQDNAGRVALLLQDVDHLKADAADDKREIFNAIKDVKNAISNLDAKIQRHMEGN